MKSERELVNYLVSLPSGSEWVWDYLDLVKTLFEGLGLKEDDPRFALTMPRQRYMLPVSVNNRYCLLPGPSDGEVGASILLPSELIRKRKTWHGGRLDGQFKPQGGETHPPVAFFFSPFDLILQPIVLETWIKAVSSQLQRGKSSSNRTYHSRAALRAALDPAYRQSVMKMAYPDFRTSPIS